MAELDFSDIQPGQPLSFDDIKPKSLMDYGQDVGKGFMRGAKKRKIGTQQAADDIRRWLGGDMGEEMSPYRQGLDQEVADLRKASKNAPSAEKGGEILYDVAEGGLVPIKGANLAQKFLWNAGTGGLMGMTMPTTSPDERIDNAIVGLGTNAIGMPATAMAAKGGLKVARTVGHAVNDRFARHDATRAAAEEISKELGRGGKIDMGGGDFGGTSGGSGGYGPDRWGQIEGANPTAAMVFQTPEILQLEKNARVRSGTKFLERDIDNQTALWNSLKNRVYGDQDLPPGGYEGVRNYLNSLANTITTPLRDDAMDTARKGLLEDVPLWVESKAKGLLSDVKTRSNPNAKKIGKETLGILDDLDKEGLGIDPEDIYNIKKMYADRLSQTNPQAMDDMTNATKAGRVFAKDIMNAADTGLNSASVGKWDLYNQTHSGMMKPIDEMAAMGKVLDSFENTATLPNRPSIPMVTRAKLDSAVSNNTWKHQGDQGYLDLLSPESRGLLSEAQDFTQAIEHAKGGGATNAISGSQTAPHAMQALKNGLKKIGDASNVGWVISLADSLGTSQGQRALDEALLDPEKLKTIVDAYNHGAIGIEYSPVIQAMKRSLRSVPSLLSN
jgi:hypothetical protein